MKTRLMLFCLCSVLCLCSHAQQRYYGQWSLTGGGGYGNEGWHLNLSGEKYLGHTLSALKVGFTFTHRQEKFKEWNIPVSRYNLNVGYFYSLERQMGGMCFINAGGSIFTGAESFHKLKLPYGVIQKEGTKFVIGILLTPQLEFIFNRNTKLSGFIEPNIGYDFLSRLDNFIYNIRVGIKYYF